MPRFSILYRSGSKKKTKNLQNASKIDELHASEEEELEEQAKSSKKKRAADRPSRADAQVSTKETKLKLFRLRLCESFPVSS